METRLDLLDTELANRIKRTDPGRRRAMALDLARYALTHASVDNPVVKKTLEEAAKGGLIQASRQKRALEALVEKLDSIQWNLRKQVDNGEATIDQYLSAWQNARAVNALLYALDADTYIATSEAAYEAYTVTSSLEEIQSILNS